MREGKVPRRSPVVGCDTISRWEGVQGGRTHHVAVMPCLPGDVTSYILASPRRAGSGVMGGPRWAEDMLCWLRGGVGVKAVWLDVIEVVRSLSSSEDGSSWRESQNADVLPCTGTRSSAASCSSSLRLRLAARRIRSASSRSTPASRTRSAASRKQKSASRRSSSGVSL